MKHVHNVSMGLNSQTLLVIKLPDVRLLCVMSRSVLLALVLLAMPFALSILKESMEYSVPNAESNTFNFEQLDLLLHDLADEGVLRKVDKALIVCPRMMGVIPRLIGFDDYEIDMVMDSDLERQSSFVEDSFDFVFTSNLLDVKFVDRIVKMGGIVAVSPSNDLSNAFIEKGNFKFLFVRQSTSTSIMAMRKTGESSSKNRRRLCQYSREVKKAALKGLEDVLLEPPRQALRNSRYYSRKIKFLPHLLGASLEAFRRRVFVNSGLPEQKKVVTDWFHKNYPKMKQEFEVYNLDEAPEEATGMVAKFQNDISDWLLKNVEENDYVVMKAEADLVEEMIEKRTIRLVDELFLECKNQWWQVGKKSKRAYWECLALYGRLRDEGVAVHQWWG